MADMMDLVQQRTEEMLARNIALVTHRPVTVSASFCEDCDSAIPEARRRAMQGVTRCVACQEFTEMKVKQ
ncbi:TraR/DksA C4-type zinc finger protein [Erwinia psidii]|uniref:TraR/DksA family transcriptional regulator n=1 Tax=Erwinia psidii TaxID=69224 RepID=A0A3N6SA33_9GAMM|nr:TraR/DksA C4-type zinc finger protein [Erwinia psidii]MCX8962729.1 TraR/DksA family transcriptional regulator [Erwinia psidii]RQM36833.1 TraR/DksA family transcriptional regulator [Erwinia psidii]